MSFTKEEHLLQKLSEESVEVSKEVSKALLFGLYDIEPDGVYTNQEKIQNELADLLGVVDMLCERGILNSWEIFADEKRQYKKDKVKKWMQYSYERGITQ